MNTHDTKPLASILEKNLTNNFHRKFTLEWPWRLKAFFKKNSHQKRMTLALKMLKKLNQPHFKAQPGLFFSWIRQIEPFVFEELLLLSFLFRGIKIIQNKRYTGDGGIDGIVILNNERIAIQAKRYTQHINPAHITDFKQVLIKHRCQGGIFIHTGKSGPSLYENLSTQILLISGANLHKLITQAYGP